MCIYKPPDPKAAPSPPDRSKATLAAIQEQRAQAAGRTSGASNILTRLSDEEVAASSRKKKLGA